MNIRIMLFIVMMMVMPVSYAACYSELSVQHNLVVQGDFALTQTQMATYEHNAEFTIQVQQKKKYSSTRI